MWVISSQEDIERVENERSLVGVYVDRNYSQEKIDWLLEAKNGFDIHAKDAWHLLLPIKDQARSGYQFEENVFKENYGYELAGAIIDRLEIKFSDLPCIVFRASGQEFFFLKLGGKSKDEFYEEIGRVADLAKECQSESKAEGQAYRDYVNMHVCNHLRRRKLLSATKSALPALSTLLGGVVDITELV